VPFKANQDRRHRIPKQRHRVTNWAGYDAALRRRGSLTVWFSDEAIAAWRAAPRTTRGGQPHYSALAIGTALALRAVFRPSRCRLRLMADGSGHICPLGWPARVAPHAPDGVSGHARC
jgi:hypothetical protein